MKEDTDARVPACMFHEIPLVSVEFDIVLKSWSGFCPDCAEWKSWFGPAPDERERVSP